MQSAVLSALSIFGLWQVCGIAHGYPLLEVNQATLDCQEAVHQAGSELTLRHGVTINGVTIDRASHDSNPYPDSQQVSYSLVTRHGLNASDMEKQASWNAESLMNSPKLQERIAHNIILRCPEVSIVVFQISNSSYSIPVFRMGSGYVRVGVPVNIECGNTSNANTPRLQWGYFYGGC
jgi:hypothetical protein